MNSRPLHIGINALFRGKPTGVANYIIHLVRELARLDGRNRYDLFMTESNRAYFDVRADNFRPVVCPAATDHAAFRRVWEQVALPRLARQRKLDILHCPTNVLPLLARCKCVVTVLDCQCFEPASGNTFLRSRFNRLFLRKSLHKADRVLAISASTKAQVERLLGVDPARILVTHLGQDRAGNDHTARAAAATEPRAGPARQYLLFTGFPHFRKNIPAFLRAFALARKRLPTDCTLVICGDLDSKVESDYPRILRVRDELGLADRVQCISYLPREELMDLMRHAAGLVMPSLCEGFGLPVVEAMACGTPVLVSDIPTMRELVADAGVYVDPCDVDDMASGICTLLTDAALRLRLSTLGPLRAARFTWENTARATLQCYEDLGHEP